MTVVEARDVQKTYHFGETQVQALRGVSLKIQSGEFVAIWGPSGSGKSTLCNLLGLLDEPSQGQILLKGQAVGTFSDNRLSEVRNEAIGFVFQNFNLVPVLSALENVMLPMQIQGVPLPEAQQRAMALLEEVDLTSHSHHRPTKLSGGQQQRVAIARALVSEPAMVIADEPTANLDSVNADRIIRLMRKVNRTHHTAFLFSTHDDRLLGSVDRHVRLKDGTIEEDVEHQAIDL